MVRSSEAPEEKKTPTIYSSIEHHLAKLTPPTADALPGLDARSEIKEGGIQSAIGEADW